MRNLSLTLFLVLVPLMTASLALGAYLNYASVRNSYVEMVGARMETVARRIATDAQVALSMGLPLAGQDALDRLLRREKDADPLILSVDVVSASGAILFSSDPRRAGLDDPGPALDGEAERRVVDVTSAFDTVEGRVVVRASGAEIAAALDGLGRQIATAAAVALGGGLAVTLGLVVVNVRALVLRLTRRAETASGRSVPAEITGVIERVDLSHREIAAAVGLAERQRAEG